MYKYTPCIFSYFICLAKFCLALLLTCACFTWNYISYLYSIYVFNIFDNVWNLVYFLGYIGPELRVTRQRFPLYQVQSRAQIYMLFYVVLYFDFP